MVWSKTKVVLTFWELHSDKRKKKKKEKEKEEKVGGNEGKAEL